MNAVVTFISLIYGFIFKTTQCFYAIEIVFFFRDYCVPFVVFAPPCFCANRKMFHMFSRFYSASWPSLEK